MADRVKTDCSAEFCTLGEAEKETEKAVEFLKKPIQIGDTYIKNRVFCAPLAGYTDFAFRKLCYRFGAGLCFTEMVSAKGLRYNSEATKLLLYKDESEPQTAAQLFGRDPQYLRDACESGDLAEYAIVDLNMGCPVPKVYKNGEGSALLADLPLASELIRTCKKSGKTVTVKFRIGLDKQRIVAADFAKMCEDSGADAITVHGRTRDAYYSGEPDYAAVAAAKNAVKIPVIANGGIFSRADAAKMLDRTGADGVMLARAAMYDPHVFSEILYGERDWDRLSAIRAQTEDMLRFYGEKFTVVQMRKMTAFYTRGMRGGARYRSRLFACNDIESLKTLWTEIFDAEKNCSERD